MKSISHYIATIVLLALATTSLVQAEDFQSLFNGKDLSGWKGLDGFWRVQDGAIVGESTRERKVDPNTFLVWQGGDVADFEFMATVRFKGNNSGVQYRSRMIDEQNLALMGYQMDLHPSAKFFGMLYGEKYGKRGKIATRGQRVEIAVDGTVKQAGKVGNEDKLVDWEWNTIHILAVGPRLIHQVNGVTTVDVTDHHEHAMTKGVLGLQLHQGAPMRVEFKDLKLRRLDATEGARLMESMRDDRRTEVQSVTTPANETEDSEQIGEMPVVRAERTEQTGGSRNRKTDANSLHIAKGFEVETFSRCLRKHKARGFQ